MQACGPEFANFVDCRELAMSKIPVGLRVFL